MKKTGNFYDHLYINLIIRIIKLYANANFLNIN